MCDLLEEFRGPAGFAPARVTSLSYSERAKIDEARNALNWLVARASQNPDLVNLIKNYNYDVGKIVAGNVHSSCCAQQAPAPSYGGYGYGGPAPTLGAPAPVYDPHYLYG